MKKRSIILAATYLLLPIQSSVFADDFEADRSDDRFEFKVAKKRANSDEKRNKKPRDRQQHPGPEMEDAEMWLYKVQVENKSLSDVDSLEARYTIYLSPSKSRRGGGPRGGGDNTEEPSVRTVTGETTLDPIKRGNREVFETVSSAIAKGGKQRGGPPGGGGRSGSGGGGPPGGGGGGGGGNGQGGGPDQPRGRETLDGLKIELFLGEQKVGEHIYGNTAKQAAAAERKREEKAGRED